MLKINFQTTIHIHLHAHTNWDSKIGKVELITKLFLRVSESHRATEEDPSSGVSGRREKAIEIGIPLHTQNLYEGILGFKQYKHNTQPYSPVQFRLDS